LLEIKGYIPNTMQDWEGMLASTVFLPRCNFRCPFCQNAELVLHPERLETVPFSVITEYLAVRAGWVEGVCITGGEPCLHDDLPKLCADLHERGVKVKLDTNGSFPSVLEGLVKDGLVDFVSMDVKAPLEHGPYKIATGIDKPDLVDLVSRSIDVLRSSSVPHDFRTTVVPLIHGPAEIARIAEHLVGEDRYVLQQFIPHDTIDPRFSALRPFTEEDMETMLKQARLHVPGAVIRGAPAQVEKS
jgi:pyruvate formate lyase activating enzyme